MTGTTNFMDVVIFSRKMVGSTFASLQQNMTQCYVVKRPPDNYNLTCGTGTNDDSTNTKLYILLMKNVSESDITNWSCFLNVVKQFSNYFILSLASK